jgi:D-alanine-D-alanine ligase
MRIGLTFDLKTDQPPADGLPDDAHEELDSPVTVEAIASVLRACGHEVALLGDGPPLLRRLLDSPLDFVFNFAEGTGVGRSREARVPAVLEMLGIPYSGPDPLAAAVTLDKDRAKRLVASAGVAVPRWTTWAPDDDLFEIAGRRHLPYTAIVKPAWEGSSKGIRGRCVVDTPEELVAAVEAQRRAYQQPIMAEEYVAGDELTVGIVGNGTPQVVGVMRVLPRQAEERFVYSLEVKRDWQNRVRYECPARLPSARIQAVEAAAVTAYHALGCRDVARVDFRMRDGTPYFLEVNPLPGLNPESSDLVIMARLVGWSYERLVGAILDAALARYALPALR